MTITLDQITAAACAEAESTSESMEQRLLSLLRLAFDCAGFASHPKRCESMTEAAAAWHDVVQACDGSLEVLLRQPREATTRLTNIVLDFRNEATARMELHQ